SAPGTPAAAPLMAFGQLSGMFSPIVPFRPAGPIVLPRAGVFAAVDGGSVVGFTGTLSAQQKADVLNPLLFAQLSANARHDRYRDVILWYKAYLETLLGIGWEILPFNFQRHRPANPRFKLQGSAL